MAPEEGAEPVRSAVIALDAPVSSAATQEVLRRARTLLGAGGYRELICDVSGRPDLGLIDALARLALLTQRSQACLRIRAVGSSREELADLVALTGLQCVNRLELGRKAEPGE